MLVQASAANHAACISAGIPSSSINIRSEPESAVWLTNGLVMIAARMYLTVPRNITTFLAPVAPRAARPTRSVCPELPPPKA